MWETQHHVPQQELAHVHLSGTSLRKYATRTLCLCLPPAPGGKHILGNSLDASISRGRHNNPYMPICCLTLVCQSPNLRILRKPPSLSLSKARFANSAWMYRQATMCMMSHCANDGPSRLPILTKLSLLVQFVFFTPLFSRFRLHR